MILTQRDKALLYDLHQYGLHTTRGLASRHFPGVALTTVLRRLRILETNDHIQRITCFEGGGNAWALTKAGAQAFAPAASKVHFPRFILEHDLQLTALRLRLEGCGIARSWRPEHEIRAKVARKYGLGGMKDRTVPDGLMGIEAGGLKESVAVELELSPKNQSRYQRIFREYGSKESLWGFWYVVENPTIGRQLMTAAKDSYHFGNRPYFVWSVLSEVMNDPLNATVRGYKSTQRLGELWMPQAKELPLSPAHLPAQAMSRLEEKNGKEEANLSNEEENEMLTDAS